jgi:2-dehydro-3-deoxyphosphogluconate aldolase/(4S)-4-hydroxy-2-oxoglutarate aldolase
VKWASKHSTPFFPGVDSTLGIEKALGLGLNTLKMFPATELGGPGWLKAMKDPYQDVRFLPTGGITADNMAEYLRLPNVIAIGGTFLAPKDLILGQKFAEITAICKKAVATIAATRA